MTVSATWVKLRDLPPGSPHGERVQTQGGLCDERDHRVALVLSLTVGAEDAGRRTREGRALCDLLQLELPHQLAPAVGPFGKGVSGPIEAGLLLGQHRAAALGGLKHRGVDTGRARVDDPLGACAAAGLVDRVVDRQVDEDLVRKTLDEATAAVDGGQMKHVFALG